MLKIKTFNKKKRRKNSSYYELYMTDLGLKHVSTTSQEQGGKKYTSATTDKLRVG